MKIVFFHVLPVAQNAKLILTNNAENVFLVAFHKSSLML